MKRYRWMMIITYMVLAVCGFVATQAYNGMARVTLTKAQVGRVVDSVTYSGTVYAREVSVYAEKSARVSRVYVNKGQYVKAGEMLAGLDVNDIASIRVQNELYDSVFSQVILDQEMLKQAISAVKNSSFSENVRVGSAAVRAPIDGYVSEIYVVEDEYAGVVLPMFVIADHSRMTVRVQVPENKIADVQIGQVVSVSGAGFGGATHLGRVTSIGNRAVQSVLNNEGAKIAVEVSLNEECEGVMPGFTATASIRLGIRNDVIKLPLEVLNQDDSGEEYVWILRDGCVYKTYISCRYTAYGYAELTDFDAEQWVVMDTTQPLREGMAVLLSEEWAW